MPFRDLDDVANDTPADDDDDDDELAAAITRPSWTSSTKPGDREGPRRPGRYRPQEQRQRAVGAARALQVQPAQG
eukprot:4223302-Prymnesium_polylepis.1